MKLTDADVFTAGTLLGSAKSGVRNTSIAVTETTTRQVREVLTRQLNQEIHAHARIFYYMYSRGLYPSHNVDQLIQNDIMLAQKVLGMGM